MTKYEPIPTGQITFILVTIADPSHQVVYSSCRLPMIAVPGVQLYRTTTLICWSNTLTLWYNEFRAEAAEPRGPGRQLTPRPDQLTPTFSSTRSTCGIWPPLFVSYSDFDTPLFVTLRRLCKCVSGDSPITTHADPPTFTITTLWPTNTRATDSDIGLIGEQSSQNVWFRACFGRRRTAKQNLTLLALSSAEKTIP